MVHICLTAKRGRYNSVLKTVNKHKWIVSGTRKVSREIYLSFDQTNIRSKKFKEINAILQQTDDLESFETIDPYIQAKNTILTDAFCENNYKLILDVDRTITRGSPGTIHHSIPPILQKMNDRGIWVYLATGRSVDDLTRLTNKYPIGKNSIAENGGIILGFGTDGYVKFGKKDEPRKVLDYLKRKYRTKEDMAQGERITEVIFLQKDLPRPRLEEAIKATKAKVDVHEGKNSYHVSARNINKGSAILELADRLDWGNSFKIAVGDSHLDVPMFKACEYSFAPKNCDEQARKACTQVLGGKYEKCLKEIYALIEKSDYGADHQ